MVGRRMKSGLAPNSPEKGRPPIDRGFYPVNTPYPRLAFMIWPRFWQGKRNMGVDRDARSGYEGFAGMTMRLPHSAVIDAGGAIAQQPKRLSGRSEKRSEL